MPPDEDPTATVVADPTAGPSVPEAPAVPGTEEEPDVSERERPEGEPAELETEEEPAAPDAEAATKQFLDQIRDIAESHPELAPELFGTLPQEFRDGLSGPEAERHQWDRERAQGERQQGLTAAYQGVARYAPQNLKPSLRQWAISLRDNLKGMAQDVADGKAESLGEVLDADAVADAIVDIANGSASAWMGLTQQQAANAAFDALEDHPAHLHLNADDKKALKEAASTPPDQRVKSAIKVYLDAAIRAAPEEAVKKAKAQADKDSGLIEQLAKFKNEVNLEGKRSRASQPAPSKKTYKDMTEEERAKLTPAEIDAMTAKFAAGVS